MRAGQPNAPTRGARLITLPAHALLILEERLREQEAEGVEMPAGMERDELALRILTAVAILASYRRQPEAT
jgi:hypothetical protein